jgi:hypothetical protein
MYLGYVEKTQTVLYHLLKKLPIEEENKNCIIEAGVMAATLFA